MTGRERRLGRQDSVTESPPVTRNPSPGSRNTTEGPCQGKARAPATVQEASGVHAPCGAEDAQGHLPVNWAAVTECQEGPQTTLAGRGSFQRHPPTVN